MIWTQQHGKHWKALEKITTNMQHKDDDCLFCSIMLYSLKVSRYPQTNALSDMEKVFFPCEWPTNLLSWVAKWNAIKECFPTSKLPLTTSSRMFNQITSQSEIQGASIHLRKKNGILILRKFSCSHVTQIMCPKTNGWVVFFLLAVSRGSKNSWAWKIKRIGSRQKNFNRVLPSRG